VFQWLGWFDQFLLNDPLSSASTVINQAGAVQAHHTYSPYGGNRGGAYRSLTTQRFTGQYHEASLPGGEGLYYYNARWYDAQLGRFAQADTLVPSPSDPQSLNRFSSVQNNPLRFVDPTGHYLFEESPNDPAVWRNGKPNGLQKTLYVCCIWNGGCNKLEYRGKNRLSLSGSWRFSRSKRQCSGVWRSSMEFAPK
jgi:RHS repeat-associated protein